MSTDHGGESGQGAMRLRGGCIPCPVCRVVRLVASVLLLK